MILIYAIVLIVEEACMDVIVFKSQAFVRTRIRQFVQPCNLLIFLHTGINKNYYISKVYVCFDPANTSLVLIKHRLWNRLAISIRYREHIDAASFSYSTPQNKMANR